MLWQPGLSNEPGLSCLDTIRIWQLLWTGISFSGFHFPIYVTTEYQVRPLLDVTRTDTMIISICRSLGLALEVTIGSACASEELE